MSHFYKIEIVEKEMTGTQHILATDSKFSLWRNLLHRDSLSLHQLAARIKKYTEQFDYKQKMPTEHELGHGLLRLTQEGLIGMTEKNGRPLIKFKRLHKDAVVPSYAKNGDAGADVRSVYALDIGPGETKMVDLGFSIEIAPGWEVQVRPRSGLAAKFGITVLNSPGTIDSGYRGPCKVILHNTSKVSWTIGMGDRVAQFVVKRAPQAIFEEVEELSNSSRGTSGFGSTGVK